MAEKLKNLNFLCSYEFLRQGGVRYSSGQFDAAVWDRYLSCSQALTIYGYEKLSESSDITSMSCVGHFGVDFRLFSKQSGIPLSVVMKLIRSRDATVCRSSLLGVFVSAVRSIIGRPTVLEIVACPWDSLVFSGRLSRVALAPLVYLLSRFSILLNKNIVYVTDEFLQRRYPPSVKAKSISCSNVELAEEAYVGREAILNCNESVPFTPMRRCKIGLIGGYETRYKGQRVLIDAIASDPELLKTFEVEFVGQGSAEDLSSYAAEAGVKSRFLGVLQRDSQLFPWLDSLDVYCQPSFQEGLPRSVLEALARGVAVLGSDAGGIPELLPDANIFKSGDFLELAERLRRFASEPFVFCDSVYDGYDKALTRQSSLLRAKREAFLRAAFFADK